MAWRSCVENLLTISNDVAVLFVEWMADGWRSDGQGKLIFGRAENGI